MFHAVCKVFLYRSGDPAKPRVLLLAPTVHSGLDIPCRGRLLPLNYANKAELRNKYLEVELVIIGEISMVSSKLFYQIHKPLNEIFSPGQDVSFGGKSVLVCGDLCQLQTVCAKSVLTFNDTESIEGFISMDLWRKFRLAELDQVMRQDDEMFVNMLNQFEIFSP